MADSDPISYLALTKGTPIVSASGTQFGKVEHVLQEELLDLFDGLAVKTAEGLRFVDADQVASITVGSVQTTLTDDETDSLPEPKSDGVFAADPEQNDGPGLTAWFGRTFQREHWTRKRVDDE